MPALAFSRGRLPQCLGDVIATVRKGAGLARIDLASAAGIAPRTLARIERGAQRPSPPTLRAVAAALGLRLGQLAPLWAEDEGERVISGAVAPGVAVRVLRIRRGLTQADVAAAAKISVATLSRFERGLHAPRGITALGDRANGAAGRDCLAITSGKMARVLGFETPFELTRACAMIEADDQSGLAPSAVTRSDA